MIDSIIYGTFAAGFLIFLNIMVLKVYKFFPSMGIGLVYGSLGVKLLFLVGYTFLIRSEIQSAAVYAFIILGGVIYSNVHTIITLHKNNDI